jgi:predicted ATPase
VLKQIQFKNFRVLRDATLPLSQVTVIVGPNGCGKSTVLQSLEMLRKQSEDWGQLVSVDRRVSGVAIVLTFTWNDANSEFNTVLSWTKENRNRQMTSGSRRATDQEVHDRQELTSRIRVYSFDPVSIASPANLQPNIQLERSGQGLAGVLDNLRDAWHERFEALNSELSRWLPEFDRIVFDVPSQGMRRFGLRRKSDGLPLFASDLSGGTLFAIALLTLAHLPNPPTVLGLEEPDHGMHPRLLRRVQDAIYRLAYPADYGEQRPPTQVILTTHSPLFLDLFKDHPEEVVVANKDDQGVSFQRLADRPRMDEILPEGPLGDLWYSGLLGGVPAEPVQP